VGALEYKIRGRTDTSVLFLNTDYPENDAEFREATEQTLRRGALSSASPGHRIGYRRVPRAQGPGARGGSLPFNESHAAFATIEVA